LQEILASLSRYGLVERRAKGGWLLVGLTADFAVEFSEFRTILELNAIQHVLACPIDHEIWAKHEQLRQEHHDLEKRIETGCHEFSKLDKKFHVSVNSVVKNRVVSQFGQIISLIFHYHYMWDKPDEKARNLVTMGEHLAIISALQFAR
jgi:DNA-binding GntR family transcriptional regulator